MMDVHPSYNTSTVVAVLNPITVCLPFLGLVSGFRAGEGRGGDAID